MIPEDEISLELPTKLNKNVTDKKHKTKTGHKFEYDFFKRIDHNLVENMFGSIKKHCYDNELGWSIVKSSTICFAGMLVSFQLKNLMRNLD